MLGSSLQYILPSEIAMYILTERFKAVFQSTAGDVLSRSTCPQRELKTNLAPSRPCCAFLRAGA
jgi:hypothetical protein